MGIPAMISAKKKIVWPKPTKDLMAVLSNYHIVQLTNDDNYNDMLTWCLENCQNKFRDLIVSSGRAWYFQNEQDAVMFAMKWSS